jgi:RNA polymerase sigma-70 factor (ECF subfamily)
MKTKFSTNTDLISSLRNGDDSAYSFLVQFYHKKLCVYAFSITKDHDLAEDIVQNVFLKTW